MVQINININMDEDLKKQKGVAQPSVLMILRHPLFLYLTLQVHLNLSSKGSINLACLKPSSMICELSYRNKLVASVYKLRNYSCRSICSRRINIMHKYYISILYMIKYSIDSAAGVLGCRYICLRYARRRLCRDLAAGK